MFYSDRAIIEQAFAHQEEGKNLMLIAEANRFPIGQVWIDLTKKRAQGVGILWALRVLPPFQSQNIGTRLLIEGEAALVRRGFEFAELSVAKDNPRAKNLYHRQGYKLAQPHKLTTDERADEWILRKILKPEPCRNEEPLGRN